jgi:hypothetical protein
MLVTPVGTTKVAEPPVYKVCPVTGADGAMLLLEQLIGPVPAPFVAFTTNV